VIVVLGHRADEVATALRLPDGARTTVNADYALGQSTSLRAGIREVDPTSRAAVVLLGDQPRVSPDVVRMVIDAYEMDRRPVVQATYGGRAAHPVLFDRRVWPEIEALEGDIGARDLLDRHPEWVTTIEVGGELPPDVDTWEDYERITREESPP
jgi:molybdenum cofactor cytidylyltransferase